MGLNPVRPEMSMVVIKVRKYAVKLAGMKKKPIFVEKHGAGGSPKCPLFGSEYKEEGGVP